MSYLSESFLWHLLYAFWLWLEGAWRQSFLGCQASRFFAWLSRKWESSFLVHLFYDESRLSRLWPESMLRRLIDLVLNLPLYVIQWIYKLLRRPFDESFFATLAFEIGKEAFVAASWFIAIILCIPYKYWNNAYSVLLFAFVLCLIFLGAMNDLKVRLSTRDFGPYLPFFFFAVAAAVPLSDYPSLSGRYLVYHVACILVVVSLVNAVSNSRQLLRLGGGLGLGILAAAGYGIFQGVVIGVDVNPSYVDLSVNADMPGRVYSYFENPNALGELLLLGLPIMVALIFTSRRWWGKLAALAVFGIGGVCMAMTYSRASWVGLAAAAFIYVFLWNRKLIPLGIVVAIAAIPVLPDSVLNRILTITNLNDTSTSSRFPQYEAAIRLLKHDPITGAGLGADAVRQAVKMNSYYQGTAPFVHAHNTLMQIWAETGIVGLLAFCGSVIWTVKETARAVKTAEDQAARHIAIGGIAAILGAMVCGLADYLWTYPRIMFVFWFVFGLTLAAIKVCKLERERV